MPGAGTHGRELLPGVLASSSDNGRGSFADRNALHRAHAETEWAGERKT